MSQHYSDPARESDEHALPDIEVWQATAEEVAQMDEDAMWEALKGFPLAAMNSREQEKALKWAVEEYEIEGGYFWQSCFPGCMPNGEPEGPFKTREAALADAREGVEL